MNISRVEGLFEEIELFEVVAKGGADGGVRGRHACKCFAVNRKFAAR
jgi:hypothetical protein